MDDDDGADYHDGDDDGAELMVIMTITMMMNLQPLYMWGEAKFPLFPNDTTVTAICNMQYMLNCSCWQCFAVTL